MLNYLLEVSLCWLGFYLLYIVWLSKETFFHLNRWYLLVTLLLGLVIPFAEMATDTTAVHPAWNYLETVTITVQQAEAEVATVVAAPLSTNWSVQDMMLWIYGIGIFWMTVRFVFGLAQIYRCCAGSTKEEHAAYTVLYNKDIPLPFSFFHYMFLNASANYTATEKDSIIRHELVHIKGRHSIDVLLVEILNILFWCSPLIYGYRRSLRNVHEYLADSSVLQTTTKKQYGQLLLQQFQKGPGIAMANNFIHSQLKKRIQMMTRNQSTNTARWKYFSAVPVFVLLLFALSKTELVAQSSPAVKPATDGVNQEGVHPAGEDMIDPIIKEEEMPRFPGCENIADKKERHQCAQTKLLQFVYENIKYPAAAQKNGVEGMVVVRFLIDKEGNIKNPEILKEIGGGCGEEALRVVKQMPQWIPARQSGEKVSTYFNLPVRYKLDGESRVINVEENKFPEKENSQPLAALKESKFPEDIFTVVEEMPRFPGCEDIANANERSKCAQEKLLNFVYTHIKYPKTAQDAGAEGMVVVQFVIDMNGKVTSPKILKSPGFGLDKSVLAMMDDMMVMEENWIPGKQSGRNVNVQYNLPVRFKLDAETAAETRSESKPNNTLEVPSFSMSPNPTMDQVRITFEMEDTKGLALSVTDATGQEILFIPNNAFTKGANEHILNLKNAPSGVLFITLKKDNKVFTKELVKQ